VGGGGVHGGWPGLGPGELNEGRELRYTVDFRDVFLAAARWLGVTDGAMVVPGYAPGPDPGIFG
jgi:uncharacterized protein (DUF1501 family)